MTWYPEPRLRYRDVHREGEVAIKRTDSTRPERFTKFARSKILHRTRGGFE